MDLGAQLHQLSGFLEPEMRRFALLQHLRGLSDEDAVLWMAVVARRARETVAMEVVYMALAELIDREELGYERHVSLYQEAKRQSEELVARLLLTGGMSPGSQRPAPEPWSEPSKPLGYRKAQARSPRRDVLERLLTDPDPTVLQVLLANPRAVTRDAVRLAARRPTTGEAQREVLRSRFGRIYEVRLALALNPYSPVDLAARLLPGLLEADVRYVSRNQELAEALRQAALQLLRERGAQTH